MKKTKEEIVRQAIRGSNKDQKELMANARKTQNNRIDEKIAGFEYKFGDLLSFVAREYPYRNYDRHLRVFLKESLEQVVQEARYNERVLMLKEVQALDPQKVIEEWDKKRKKT